MDNIGENSEAATEQNSIPCGEEFPVHSAAEIKLLVFLIVAVCVAVLVAHWPVLSTKTILFDDKQYFTENPLVQNPGWNSVKKFLTEVLEPSTVKGYYQPLTMISLMLDYAAGARPGNLMPLHRTSLILHMANTALVIVLLYMLFGRALIAAMVGLLFGVHPMTVEPIAWIAEHKTLLAMFFSLWSLVLYVRYTDKGDWRIYLGCVVTYVLALMSKPTSLPLPALMLLMDYWPLRRLRWCRVVEKLPLLGIGCISAVITYISQSRTYLVLLPGQYNPLGIPLVICHNIIFYLYKIFCPNNLSTHYGFPEPLLLSEPMILIGVVGTCVLILLLLISLRWTVAVAVSWLFFFLAILPTMQIIGFSDVIAADKFVYLPSLGLLLMSASFLHWFCAGKNLSWRCLCAITIVLVLAGAEISATRKYLVHWRDTVSLYQYMLTTSRETAKIHNALGNAFDSQGDLDKAAYHYRKALENKPDYIDAHNNLGLALALQEKFGEAASHFREALGINPEYAAAHYNLGLTLQSQGKPDDAIEHFRLSIRIEPGYTEAQSSLGAALLAVGKIEEAINHFHQALGMNPDDADARFNLALAFQSQGKLNQAAEELRGVLKLVPDDIDARCNLGEVLVKTGRLEEALKHFRYAVGLRPDWSEPARAIEWILAERPDLRADQVQ